MFKLILKILLSLLSIGFSAFCVVMEALNLKGYREELNDINKERINKMNRNSRK